MAIAKAAEDRARIEDGLAAMAEWAAEEGPLTDEELAEAVAELARADVLAQRHRKLRTPAQRRPRSS